MALLPDFTNVLCWETGMGLTSHNDPALQSEINQAIAGHAQIYIAVHVNGGAPSGFSRLLFAGRCLLRALRGRDPRVHVGQHRPALPVHLRAGRSLPARSRQQSHSHQDPAGTGRQCGRSRVATEPRRPADAGGSPREGRPRQHASAPIPPRCEQTDPLIAYTGAWVNFAKSGASAGSYLYADSAASATIYFDGTRLDWIATKGVTMGLATVSLDGGAPSPSISTTPTVLRQKTAWSTGTLPGGPTQAGDPLDR